MTTVIRGASDRQFTVTGLVHQTTARHVRTLNVVYYGRNTNPSLGYRNWHPLEWLATDPAGLFREYQTYRSVLARHIASEGITKISMEDI